MRIPNLRNRLPPLGSLAAFEAASRHGSFTRAALELHLTQAAISRQIRALEDHIGQPLFERRRHDVALTEAGRRFAEGVNPSLSRIAETAQSLCRGAQVLIVAAEFCLATHCLMPRLPRFQAAHPDLQLRLLTSSDPTAGEDFDLCLAYGLPRDPGLTSIPLAEDRIFPVARPGACPVRSLADAELIHFEQRGFDWMGWEGFLRQFGTAPTRAPRLTFGTYHNALEAALQGSGIALGWGLAVAQPLADGRLVPVTDLWLPSPDPLCLHMARDRRASEAARSFVAWAKAEVQG